MSRKAKKGSKSSRTRTKLKVSITEKSEDFAAFRDRKPGSYNQLWDWKTFEDVEIKRV